MFPHGASFGCQGHPVTSVPKSIDSRRCVLHCRGHPSECRGQHSGTAPFHTWGAPRAHAHRGMFGQPEQQCLVRLVNLNKSLKE